MEWDILLARQPRQVDLLLQPLVALESAQHLQMPTMRQLGAGDRLGQALEPLEELGSRQQTLQMPILFIGAWRLLTQLVQVDRDQQVAIQAVAAGQGAVLVAVVVAVELWQAVALEHQPGPALYLLALEFWVAVAGVFHTQPVYQACRARAAKDLC